MGIKVCKGKHISRWVDWENLMLDEIESRTVHNNEEGNQ